MDFFSFSSLTFRHLLKKRRKSAILWAIWRFLSHLLWQSRQKCYSFLRNKKSPNPTANSVKPGLSRGATRIWTGDRGVADLCLTTWLWRHNDPCGIRTRVTAVKGRCLNPLTNGPWTPRVGFEPTTLRLTAGCSTAELSRISVFDICPSVCSPC